MDNFYFILTPSAAPPLLVDHFEYRIILGLFTLLSGGVLCCFAALPHTHAHRNEKKNGAAKMTSVRPDDKTNDVPEILVDNQNRKTYKRLRYFGKVS